MLLLLEKHAKYVKLLRALINCDGEAIVQNQEEITKLILGDSDTSKKLIFKLKRRHGVIHLFVYGMQIPLNTFKKQSQQYDEGDLYDYFTTLILLLSDLCLDRNIVAIVPLSKIYQYDKCY